MTGLVERSSSKYFNFQTTHLAFVRRSQQHDHHFNQGLHKNNHLNSFLTNLELGKMLPNTHHSLDNQYQSAQKLQQNLSSRRCDSTSSDSSTSTFVDDGFQNDDTSCCTQNNLRPNNKMVNQHEQDLILVLPVSFSNANVTEEGKKQNSIASKNELSSTSNKKCCSVQCIDSMSTASSVCPPCPAPMSNCFKKSPVPFKKDTTPSVRHDERKETMQKRKPSMHSLAKANFTHFIRIPTSSSPYKGISEDTKTCKNSSNKVQIPNSRVHQLLKSPFKEWLL